MAKAIHDKSLQLKYLTKRLQLVLQVLDHIDPEKTNMEDMDRLLQMVEDIEEKLQQFKKDW